MLERGLSKSFLGATKAPSLESEQTIVTSARNEAQNLPMFLRSIKNQVHSPSRILVVDDFSDDESYQILVESGLSNLEILKNESQMGKRVSLSKAFAKIQGGRIILSDADCAARSSWTKSHRGGEHEILIGYAPLKASGLLGGLIRHETFATACLMASAIGWDQAYMATGRNWSFPSELFKSVGGFEGIDESLGGDDDLLFQKMIAVENVTCRFLSDKESFVDSNGPSTWAEWFRQKRRHNSASLHYSFGRKIGLATIQTLNIATWLLPFLNLRLGSVSLLGVLLMRYFLLRETRKKFEYRVGFPGFVLREAMYVFYNLFVVPFALLFPAKEW